jgi:hypothetical protein
MKIIKELDKIYNQHYVVNDVLEDLRKEEEELRIKFYMMHVLNLALLLENFADNNTENKILVLDIQCLSYNDIDYKISYEFGKNSQLDDADFSQDFQLSLYNNIIRIGIVNKKNLMKILFLLKVGSL